jgi:large subunit ribosomal protein L18
MKKLQIKKQEQRDRRRGRIRIKVIGTPQRPRLSVYRSLVHIYAQLIDDSTGKTLAAGSDKEISKPAKSDMSVKVAKAYALGQALAAKAKQAGIEQVVFDRGGYKYHGRVKALADGAREGGLKF